MKKPLWVVIALAVFWSQPNAGAAIDDGNTVAVVEGFHASLLDVMKNADNLGVQGRYDRLKTPVESAFDLANMIRIASGSYWRKADDNGRARLSNAFNHFSVASYAAQFDGYSGQQFKTISNAPGPQQTVLVATRIVGSSGKDDDGADLTYVMKQRGERWLIADILLDNAISQLAVRRSEYRLVLKKSGIDGLLGVLNNKSGKLLAPE